MQRRLSRLDYVFLVVALLAIGITIFEWYRTTARATPHDRGRPRDMNFAFQIRADQGVRSLRELIAEEEEETGLKLRIRDTPICRLSFFVGGPKSGTDLILVVSPIAGDPTVTRDFLIPQGGVTEFPLSRETAPPIDPLRFRSDGITNASIYWAYCD